MTPSSRWNAVVLGGGDPGDTFAAAHGVRVKALIPVAGQPMALYVLQALRGSGRVDRIAYVGPTTPEMDALIDERVTDQGGLLANLEAGVRALGAQRRALIATADIPMMDADMVRRLLDAAPDVPLVYPVVRREDAERAFPGVKRTYGRLVDGQYTGGNVFLLDPALIGQFMPRLREMLEARKAPLKMALQIGPGVLLKLLLGRLSVAELEARVSRLLGVEARALVTPDAAVGTDVDKDSDLELVRQRRS